MRLYDPLIVYLFLQGRGYTYRKFVALPQHALRVCERRKRLVLLLQMWQYRHEQGRYEAELLGVLVVTSVRSCPGRMIFKSQSGQILKISNTWSSISRCCPVTHTSVSNSCVCFLSSCTRGAILMASGLVPKTSITFFLICIRLSL